MQKINYSEFVEFFQSEIVPEIQPYEKYRIKLCKKRTFITKTISIQMVLLFIFYGAIAIVRTPENEGILAWVGFLIIFFFVLFIMKNIKNKKSLEHTYKTTVKYAFYEKIFNLLGLNYSKDLSARTHIAKNIVEVFEKAGIYVGDIGVEDIISGDYNNLPFTVSDVEISHKDGVFYRLFMAIKIYKPYKGETIIMTDKIIDNPEEIDGKKAVKLEDVEFEEYFEVYGTDQIETRYLLTTAFMRRLLDYRKQKKCDIEVIFSNKIGLYKNLFFFIYTGKNHFELPVEISLLNQDLLYGLVKEITSINTNISRRR